jgi:signal recognition particle GTPase
MNPLNNPFSPGAGNQPPELAGRSELLRTVEILLARIKAGRSEQSMFMVGLRGVGKTVLLNRVRELAAAQGYQALLIEAHENKPLPQLLLPPLRQTLFALDRMQNVSQKVKRGLRVLRSFIGAVKVIVGDA